MTNNNEHNSNEPKVENTAPSIDSKQGLLGTIWRSILDRQVLQKFFTLIFAMLVFGAVYLYMTPHRLIVTYMGAMLLMVMVYAEILVIRDHLWIIEGSSREAKKWRDAFFNPAAMRKQRLRKLFALLFALAIFMYAFFKSSQNSTLSFFGIILMITVLYYEILSIRDEVHSLVIALKAQAKSKDLLPNITQTKESSDLSQGNDTTKNENSEPAKSDTNKN